MSQVTFQTSVGAVLLSSTGGPGPWQGVTDAVGKFIASLASGTYLVTASKDGYVPVAKSVVVGKKGMTVSLTLAVDGSVISDLSRTVL